MFQRSWNGWDNRVALVAGFDSIVFAPWLPWPLIAAFGAGAVLVLAAALWRRSPGAAWRALALGITLAALANPLLQAEKRAPLNDMALLVVDRSDAMAIGDRRAQADEAEAVMRQRLSRLPGLGLRVLEAGGGDGSDTGDNGVFATIRQALAATPAGRLAGIVLITDGEVADAPTAAQAARLGGPLHVLIAGHRGEGDRRLVIARAPAYGLVGKSVSLVLRIEDEGVPGGGQGDADLTLTLDGGTPQHLSLPLGRNVTVPIRLTHAGPTVVELQAAPGPRELTLANNRAALVVNGVRDRLKVLLLSGEPHPGERVWRDLLKADPSVDLVHFTILRPFETPDTTPVRELSLIAFPVRELFETKLHEFDLVIFDRYHELEVLPPAYFDNLVSYVEEGGALLDVSGPNYAGPSSLVQTSLGRILPGQPTGRVLIEGYRPTLTALGRRHPVTADLPGAGPPGGQPGWGRWFSQVEIEPPKTGQVLMDGVGGRPLLVLDRVGKGRVAQLFSDQIWLWARGFEGGGPQAELLRRLAHWLMKEPELEEENLTARAVGDRLDVTRRSLTPGDVSVTVKGADGIAHPLLLKDQPDGQATGSLALHASGVYRVSDGTHTAVAALGGSRLHALDDVRATADRLAPAAQASGGDVAWLDDGLPEVRRVGPHEATAGKGWIGLTAHGASTVTGIRQVPLLPPLAALVLILLSLGTAWWREGR